MKKTIVAIVLASAFVSAFAQQGRVVCRKQWDGSVVCSSTGY